MYDAISLVVARARSIVRQPPNQCRRVLQPRFLHDYLIQKTAQEMGITHASIKMIQHQAQARAVEVGERPL